MNHYNGIAVAMQGKSWKALKAIYSNKKSCELDLKVCEGLKKVVSKVGADLDESFYTLNLKEIAESLDIRYDFMILLIFNRWSRTLAEAVEGLVIIGDGECEECGSDSLEFHDSGEFWKTEDIYKCLHCGTLQHKRGD